MTATKHPVSIRRAYEPPEPDDGYRVLVDRLWRRGVSREHLHIDAWTRDLAPSDELRHWFGHEPARWDEFRTRYLDEIRTRAGAAAQEFADLVDHVAAGHVTLVFGARDTEHNNAVVLAEVLKDPSLLHVAVQPTLPTTRVARNKLVDHEPTD